MDESFSRLRSEGWVEVGDVPDIKEGGLGLTVSRFEFIFLDVCLRTTCEGKEGRREGCQTAIKMGT